MPRNRHTKTRLLSCAALFALCLPMQSCFTAGLWASDLRSRDKAALTPLSLTLDAVTLPVQLAVVDGHHHSGHHHSGHHHSGHHHSGHHHGHSRRCR